jgi:riboflavin synthase
VFAGIVEEMGAVKSLEKTLAGTRLTILAKAVMDDLPIGASISVNGACLTVIKRDDKEFTVDVSPETMGVTNLGKLAAGSPVNLERAMKLNERIGGHLVAGHVDGIGTVRERHQEGNGTAIVIEAPPEALRYCIAKGSITVDGVSLTINEVGNRTFSVMIIPHTAKVTTLGIKQVGDTVNLESDLIGKYVERLLQERGQLPPKSEIVIDRDYLQKKGLL